MSDSPTLDRMLKDWDQANLITKLQDSDSLIFDRGIKALGPNEKYPLPWVSVRFPGTSACSIISTGGMVDETVVSMIDSDTAEQVLQEVQDD